MTKPSVVDQIEILRAGHVQVRLVKSPKDLDHLSADTQGFHRVAIDVNGNLEAAIAAVNGGLDAMGCAPIEVADWDRVRALADHVWNKEELKPDSGLYAERQAAVAAQEMKIASALTGAADRIAQLEGIVAAQVQEIAELQKAKA